MQAALAAYIEATYHISHPKTVAIRRALLDRAGGIAQEPYVESTPTYIGDREYTSLALPDSVRSLFAGLAKAGLVFDPPYEHQAQALELTGRADAGGTGIVVTTGTGSGKTESFLLPVLARLSEEASLRPAAFSTRAVRALLLYPMNALVNDQLGRLRTLLGDEEVRNWFTQAAGRPAKFGRYTGRTLYPGRRDGARDQERLKSLSYYLSLEDEARGGDAGAAEMVDTLKRKGRWPAKPDSRDGAYDGLRSWYGAKSQRWVDAAGQPQRAVERPQDAELLTRHEMQRACPDLLVTNYSMLEYMLLRPIERSLFDDTRDYFRAYPEEKFFFILDEAHLYRGANGTEVAYLIRRFLDRLQIDASRVVFICTSASFSNPSAAQTFAGHLTGLERSRIAVLNGRKRLQEGASSGDADTAAVFASVPLAALMSADSRERAAAIAPLLKRHSVSELGRIWIRRSTPDAQRVRVSGLGPSGEPIEQTVELVDAELIEADTALAVVTSVQPDKGVVTFGRSKGVLVGTATPTEVTWEQDDLARAAWLLLRDLPVVAQLRNITSGAAAEANPQLITGSAKSISELSKLLFPRASPDVAVPATDALLELASLARPASGESPLLPARIHLMFRGLPGLWACIDPHCSELPDHLRGGPTGALFSEPRRHCGCGAQVFELWSCRACGIAVAHAYAGSPVGNQHLWPDDGAAYAGDDGVVREAYICLEEPRPPGSAGGTASVSEIDVVTGRLDGDGSRTRTIWHTPLRLERFERCPRCDAHEMISDLQTKGEEPFQQLVAVQVLEQPPRPESKAPMKGRKALVFSDGRQTASRLAGLLKSFAFRDSLRPLLLDGMDALRRSPHRPSLDDAPLAVSLSAALNQVRLRPIGDDLGSFVQLGRQAVDLVQDPDVEAGDISEHSAETSNRTPESVFQSIYAVLQDRHTGVSALALASVGPKLQRRDADAIDALAPPTVTGLSDKEAREALVRLWLWAALNARAIKLSHTPAGLDGRSGAQGLGRWNGKFNEGLRRALTSAGHSAWLGQFGNTGLPILKSIFSGALDDTFQVSARKVALLAGESLVWRRCGTCTMVSPDNPLIGDNCPACSGKTQVIAPENDRVFRSRKSFFRRATERLREHEVGFAPHQLIAEEHSAQLNDTSMVRAMSRNEAYELRFQDVPVSHDNQLADPIDVLSCTTTMEVGIDIGGLTAVALRNVPPGRANYQQRAGRAGRRGAGLSTVLMFCGADSHDQSFFRDPAPIVAGPAPDPVLNLDNVVIARRQAYAFLLGRFQQARVIGSTNPNIFESLGSTIDFLTGDPSSFSLAGLKAWLSDNRSELRGELDRLFARSCGQIDSESLIEAWPALLEEKLGALHPPPAAPAPAATDEEDDDGALEADAPDNSRSVAGSAKLLDQLFALGLMPRYAFPTDVATFAVFQDNANPFRPQLAYSPQQALNAALAQYAPGHEVWIDGKTHMSMGIWSAFEEERWSAWRERKLYYHCQVCDFAQLKELDQGIVGETVDCPACGGRGAMGPSQRWLRPVGFAHPPAMPPAPPRIDGTTNSRPTRAKLDAPRFSPDLRIGGDQFSTGAGWEVWRDTLDLVVTNRGTQSSQDQGFRHCYQCGRTEPADLDVSLRQLGPGIADHDRPRPRRPKEPDKCNGRPLRLVLGNKFTTDIAIFRLQTPSHWDLSPTRPATVIAAKSAVEALIRAASKDLEPGDIDGDYRFAPGQNSTTLLDLYIYDQAAGGAGFVKTAAADPRRLVCEALDILDRCDCEDSCYQCLRSYKNRFDHGYLDRRLGADLLRACFEGTGPVLDPAWVHKALHRLCGDMNDSGGNYEVRSGGLVSDNGRVVVLAHPFVPKTPGTSDGEALANTAKGEARAIDILMVDRALPSATAAALDLKAKGARTLQASTDGAPMLSVAEILAGADLASAQKVAAGSHEPGDFVMRLDANTLDGPLGDGQAPVPKGTPCLFRPLQGEAIDPKRIYLLRRLDGRAFGATHNVWTVGSVQQVKDGVRVRYRAASHRLECASEVISPAEAVEAIAGFVRQVK